MKPILNIAESRRPTQPRARGAVRVSVRRAGSPTALDRLYQAGSSKLLLPRGESPGATGVLLNTAGGITGGDRFSVEATAAEGARLTLSTQAAERAYRAQPGETGTVETRLEASAGARIDWLPQETILFDGARLTRRLEVDLAEDAALLAVEPVILGRPAMGEKVRDLHFTDSWRIRRAGRLVFADALRLTGDAAALAARPAGPAPAFASLVFIGAAAEGFLDPLRALLPEMAGASLVRDGVLAARLAAPDGFALRRALIPALELLRGAPLPIVWKM